MVLECAMLQIRPGEAREFERAFARASAIISSMEGFLSASCTDAWRRLRSSSCWSGGRRSRTTPSASWARRRTRSGGNYCTIFTNPSRPSSTSNRWTWIAEPSEGAVQPGVVLDDEDDPTGSSEVD